MRLPQERLTMPSWSSGLTTTARGLGAAHQRLRDRLLPLAYGKPCRRCGQPMLKGQALDLGHPEDRPRMADPHNLAGAAIEHTRCNRRAGQRLATRLRQPARRVANRREW